MAKPNYAYEKRQRELAKKQKQEAKRQRKAHGGPASPERDEASDGSPASDTAAPAPAASDKP